MCTFWTLCVVQKCTFLRRFWPFSTVYPLCRTHFLFSRYTMWCPKVYAIFNRLFLYTIVNPNVYNCNSQCIHWADYCIHFGHFAMFKNVLFYVVFDCLPFFAHTFSVPKVYNGMSESVGDWPSSITVHNCISQCIQFLSPMYTIAVPNVSAIFSKSEFLYLIRYRRGSR